MDDTDRMPRAGEVSHVVLYLHLIDYEAIIFLAESYRVMSTLCCRLSIKYVLLLTIRLGSTSSFMTEISVRLPQSGGRIMPRLK